MKRMELIVIVPKSVFNSGAHKRISVPFCISVIASNPEAHMHWFLSTSFPNDEQLLQLSEHCLHS
jgi:hypothetical protein